MAAIEFEPLHHDRAAWEATVTQILGKIPDHAVGDEAARLADALRSVSSLLRRLSPEQPATQQDAA